jgi:5-methylcytosine-specific restriction endonuclease McrA
LPWLKIDDKLHGHPKWTRCTSEAKALWITVGSWCASYKTDGIVRAHDLALLAPSVGMTPAKARKAAADLVSNEMWVVLDDGWAFHNWTDFNPSRAQQADTDAVERERRAVQQDTVMKAAVRLRDADRCCFCDVVVDFAKRVGHLAGQYDHTIPLSKGGKTTLENVRVICRFHNQTKAGKLIADLPESFPPLLEPYTHRHPVEDRLSSDLVGNQSRSRVGTGRVGSSRNGSVLPDADLFGSVPPRPRSESRWLSAVSDGSS